ncbi:hypothetical protein OIU85_000860 [Salix viminalis]|uniref:Uncharacterized protein n=1 Tax=Salix viminalis TaxID=40686 RepID=A0A9Q0VKR1_SALVM|nr:hypothetical protein OIU85_000860 [Salix viminalis]
MASTQPESPSNSGKVKEAAFEASFGCILRLKNAVNDEFLQDLLRKVLNTVFFDGEIKIDMNQEGYACFILDQLVALVRVDAWFLINCCSETYHFVENCTSNMLEPYLDEIISKLLRCLHKGKQLLKQWALSALAAIAKSSQVSRQRTSSVTILNRWAQKSLEATQIKDVVDSCIFATSCFHTHIKSGYT